MQVQWLWSSCMTLTNQYFNTSDWLEVKVKVDLSMEELFKGCISKTCCTTWCDIMVIIQPSQSTPKHRCIALNTYLGYCQLCTKCQYYNTACFIACYLVICLCGDLDLSSDKTFDSRLFSNVLILQKASRNRVIVACWPLEHCKHVYCWLQHLAGLLGYSLQAYTAMLMFESCACV